MTFREDRILSAALDGTGIFKAPHLGPHIYLYGDVPISAIDCKAERGHLLDQWKGWWALRIDLPDGQSLTPCAIRWTGIGRVKWERIWNPDVIIFGRKHEDKNPPWPKAYKGECHIPRQIK